MITGLNDEIISKLVGDAFEKSKEHTCINCGEIEQLCKCGNFENVKGRKNILFF